MSVVAEFCHVPHFFPLYIYCSGLGRQCDILQSMLKQHAQNRKAKAKTTGKLSITTLVIHVQEKWTPNSQTVRVEEHIVSINAYISSTSRNSVKSYDRIYSMLYCKKMPEHLQHAKKPKMQKCSVGIYKKAKPRPVHHLQLSWVNAGTMVLQHLQGHQIKKPILQSLTFILWNENQTINLTSRNSGARFMISKQ